MDSIFVLIAAAFLDPTRAVITLIGVLLSRKPWVILPAAALSAVATETILVALKMTSTWGEVIVPGTIASLLQAGILYLVVNWIRGRFAAKAS